MANKKSKIWGGKRSGSGAKGKYAEPTTTIAARCPESKKEELKQIIKAFLKTHQKTKQ